MDPAPTRETLSGWGRSFRAQSSVFRPRTAGELTAVFEHARSRRQTVGLRGAGQAYGDAALNSGGVTLDLSAMRRILAWDPERGVASVEPGVTIRDLWRHTLADGYWPAVVPGTSLVTLGGAAAMNVHGKNNWKIGPIGEHIEEIELVLPDGTTRVARPDQNGELFRAAIGGFGMLGAFTRIDLRMKKVHSGLLGVEPLAARNLGEMIALMNARLDQADYLVGWIDCFGRAASLGRGLVHDARYLAPGEDPDPSVTLQVSHQERPDRLLGIYPKSLLWWPMQFFYNAIGMRAVNAGKYTIGRLEAERAYRQPHAQFAFLLDFVPNWGLAYGRGGMIQYQSFIPAERAHDVFAEQIERAQSHRLVPLLGVLKRHRRDDFLITHGVDGFSLALEFKLTQSNRPRLWALARELDRGVVDSGGRFYFAKDSTLSPQSYASYRAEARTQRFLELKEQLDPEQVLQTDLYRRIFDA